MINHEKSKHESALFDLDGVIAFTDKYHYLAWKQLADEHGWYFDEEINQQLRGIPRIASLEVILRTNNVEGMTAEEKDKLANQKNAYYVDLLSNLNEDDIYPGVTDFLEKLKARGVKISLCSSSKNADTVLDALDLRKYFDAIVSGNDIVHAKPAPEIFQKGAKALDVFPVNCIVFEDARVGIQAAISARMKSVGVGNYAETADLADTFIQDYSEIDIDTFLECGKKQPLPTDEHALIERGFVKREIRHFESLFALGNGYLGFRGTYDEKTENDDAGTYINGVFANDIYNHRVPCKGFAKKNEFTVNLSDWRIFEVTVDGEKASFDCENISEHERRLDFHTGALTRRFIFTTSTGKKTLVESTRLVNRVNVHGAEIEYCVTPLNYSGSVEICSRIIKCGKLRNQYYTQIEKEAFSNETISLLHRIPSSDQYAAISVAHSVTAKNYEAIDSNTPDIYEYTIQTALSQDETAKVYKYAAFAGTIDGFDDLLAYTRDLAIANRDRKFDAFLQEQELFWKEHWADADIIIKGNSVDQQAVRYSLFQLRQQLATVNQCSIGATGLSGPQYSGKVFWDTEMYLMPYYNFTYPETQKELLMYRYRILDKARARAKEFDTVGAMYSWCSIDGEETAIVFEASTAEYHLNSVISYAVWRYVDTTEDYDFLYDYGAEIVFETAKFMSHRGCFSPARNGKFCINAVCGPDEYACGVNNNFFTNLTAKRHFEYALWVADFMQKNAPEKYQALVDRIDFTAEHLDLIQRAADNMYLPYNEQYQIFEQDDSFLYEDPVDMSKIPANVDLRAYYHPLDLWRLQVSKQADVCLAGFIHGDYFTDKQKADCYDYYEPRCNHGSSLSPAIYSIVAAELRRPETYEFFRMTELMDLNDFKRNTGEGIHIACLGGVWMCVVNGFLGLRHYKSGIEVSPAIPNAWDSYACNIAYKNALVRVDVSKHESVFTLVRGERIAMKVNGKAIVLDKENTTYQESGTAII